MNLVDGKNLITLARDSIKTYFTGKNINLRDTEKYSKKQGVFVTLSKYTNLRGCIGYPYPIYPLQRAVIEAARAAAFEDPRFPSLKQSELDEICIDLSVLTVPKIIEVEDPKEYFDRIVIGRHGLIVKKGYSSGLLLPQVFVDYGSTPKQALEMTCQKAGLDNEAWKQAEVYSFSAQIFKEEEPGGKVVEEHIQIRQTQ